MLRRMPYLFAQTTPATLPGVQDWLNVTGLTPALLILTAVLFGMVVYLFRQLMEQRVTFDKTRDDLEKRYDDASNRYQGQLEKMSTQIAATLVDFTRSATELTTLIRAIEKK